MVAFLPCGAGRAEKIDEQRAAGDQREQAAAARSVGPRFFFAGDGHLRLQHAHFDTSLDVRFRRADGSYDPAALERIAHFFRSRTDQRQRPMPLRLIELLSYIQQRHRPKQMTLLSGYRSPEFNAELGAAGQAVAMASLHTQGLAADIAFNGVNLRKLWLALREEKVGGVGYYKKQNFLHVDSGPPRFWEETTSRVSENLSAGNARLFVRSDFDRYDDLAGAVLSLQSVTTLPLRVRSAASLVDRHASRPLTLRGRGKIVRDGDCWVVQTPEDSYELVVDAIGASAGAGADPQAAQPYILIRTCEPRLERTPPEARSNPIELIE